MLDFQSRGLIQNSALARGRPTSIFAAIGVAQVASGGNHDRIEQSGFHQTPRRKLLQADAQRKHSNKRRYAHRNADGRQRISQNGFAQVSDREFAQIREFHSRPCSVAPLTAIKLASSLTSLPSARKMRRWA